MQEIDVGKLQTILKELTNKGYGNAEEILKLREDFLLLKGEVNDLKIQVLELKKYDIRSAFGVKE